MDKGKNEVLLLAREFLEHDWDELVLATDEWHLTLVRRMPGEPPPEHPRVAAAHAVPVAARDSEPEMLPRIGDGAPPGAAAGAPEREGVTFEAPMTGAFYRCPRPGAPPFVEVGDFVEAGQTMCIIEVMKLMCEIKAEFPATVLDVCMEDGSPVSKGEELFRVHRR